MAGRRLIWMGVAGGVGGLLNGALCYLRLPVPVQESGVTFQWHVVPAGMFHGAALAVCGAAGAELARGRSRAVRTLVSVLAGWVGGYLSWIPLNMSAFGQSVLRSLAWPFTEGLQALWIPFFYFGIVAALLCAWLSRVAGRSGVGAQMAATSLAGALGSLWWWVSWGPWYFSILHGAMWGVLAGSASWRTRVLSQEA